MNNKGIIHPRAHSWCKHLISVDFEVTCPTFACITFSKTGWLTCMCLASCCTYVRVTEQACASAYTLSSLMWCVCLHVQPSFSSARGRGSAIFIMSSGIHYFLFLHLSFTRSHTYAWCDWVGNSTLQYYSHRVTRLYSQVHKYWDIDTILTFLALYTTTMDFKWRCALTADCQL